MRAPARHCRPFPFNEFLVAASGDSHSGDGLKPRVPGVCADHQRWPNGEQLARPLANGDWAVLLFNRLNSSLAITLDFEDIGDTSKRCFAVRDVWSKTDLGNFTGSFVAEGVPAHGNRFLRLRALQCPPPPPAPPPAKCPDGYTPHKPGFWPRGFPCPSDQGGTCDMHNHSCSLGGKCRFHVSVAECAALCSNQTAPGACAAFEVYDPADASVCFTFSGPLAEGSFHPNAECFACVRDR